MSRNLCTSCQERLEEYFAPATSASSLSLSSYIHKAEECSLREFVETGDNDRHVNASLESSVENKARLILDQWNDTESPGILWAAARVADISESLSLQASAPQSIIEKPVLPYKIAFCQAGSEFFFHFTLQNSAEILGVAFGKKLSTHYFTALPLENI